jgi:hypothetical protein
MPPDDDVLVIDFDDEDAGKEPLPPVPAASPNEFPEITPQMLAEPSPLTPTFEVFARCGTTKNPFVVRFQETEKGIWHVVAAEPVNEAKAQAGPGPQQAAGTFSLDHYPGCPLCGMDGLLLCDNCGVGLCGGALEQSKEGKGEMILRCPTCGKLGKLAGAVATATGRVRGKKG